jgi:hypothetical protein
MDSGSNVSSELLGRLEVVLTEADLCQERTTGTICEQTQEGEPS